MLYPYNRESDLHYMNKMGEKTKRTTKLITIPI